MRYFSLLILLILISYSADSSTVAGLKAERTPYRTFDAVKLTKRQKKLLLNGDFFGSSDVETFTGKILHPDKKIEEIKMQKFKMTVAGMHPRTCRFALRKLQLYENYKQYMGFVQASSYEDKTERIYLKVSHSILPIDMVLYFILPRIKKPGVYPFHFDAGFLKDLQGEIHVSEYKNECFFYAFSHWEGPHTGFADTVFEFFSKGMGTMAMKNLFRISGGNR